MVFFHEPPDPAPLHHRTMPSSPPVINAPGEPTAAGLGRQDTDQTSPVSWIVETAARAPMSHTLIFLSADLLNRHQSRTRQSKKKKKYDNTRRNMYPESPKRPSGEMSALRTQEVCPEKEATVLPGAERTSCSTRRLSSEALNNNFLKSYPLA